MDIANAIPVSLSLIETYAMFSDFVDNSKLSKALVAIYARAVYPKFFSDRPKKEQKVYNVNDL